MRRSLWLPAGLCAAILALALLRVLLAYDALPARMASHFDGSGRANGFQPKIAFVPTMLLVQLLLVIPVVALASSLRALPDSMFNLPHRAYWLAPERRGATIARIASHLAWLGVAVNVSLAALLELTLRANLQGTRTLGVATWQLIGPLIAVFAGSMVALARAFRAPPSPR